MDIDNLDNAIYKILLDIIIKHKEYIKYNIENDFIDNLANNLSILISSRLIDNEEVIDMQVLPPLLEEEEDIKPYNYHNTYYNGC